MTYRVITITGEVCTGKSTIAHALLQMLPEWEQANTGQKFRDIVAARGTSIQEVSSLPDDVHREVDSWQQSLAQTESNMIIEGRLAGWLTHEMPHVFRVYCYSDLDVRVQRYMEREHVVAQQARAEIADRDIRDRLKYRRMYGVADYRDPQYYHLLLDTSSKTPEELARIIVDEAKLGQNSKPANL